MVEWIFLEACFDRDLPAPATIFCVGSVCSWVEFSVVGCLVVVFVMGICCIFFSFFVCSGCLGCVFWFFWVFGFLARVLVVLGPVFGFFPFGRGVIGWIRSQEWISFFLLRSVNPLLFILVVWC